MDWYDKYHCYQDANRDPPGLDRTRGRIYRISYHDTPIFKPFDLQKAGTDELVKLLDNPNVWWRRTAQRILNERFAQDRAALVPALEKIALDTSNKNNANMHALWLLVSHNAAGGEVLADGAGQRERADPQLGGACRGAGGKGAFGRLREAQGTGQRSFARRARPVGGGGGPIARAGRPAAAGSAVANPDNAGDPLIPTMIYNNLKPMASVKTSTGRGGRGPEILSFLEKNPSVEQAFGKTTVPWIRQAINAGGRQPQGSRRRSVQGAGRQSRPVTRHSRRCRTWWMPCRNRG